MKFYIFDENLTMEIISLVDSYKEKLVVQRYSSSSVKNYSSALQNFLSMASQKYTDPLDISLEDVEKFIFWKINKHHISASHQSIILSSIAKFYKLLFGKDINLKHLYPKRRETKLPKFLTCNEVKKILECTENIKHKALLTTIYSCGLRLSEVLELKISDVKSQESVLLIRQGKGKKDRIVNLSPKLLELLRTYFKMYQPKTYLFEGQNTEQYSKRSVQQVFKNSLKKANITSPATVHTLRHSYAMHLLENGTDIRIIKELLESESYRTMEDVEMVLRFFAYRHYEELSNFKSQESFLDEFLRQANDYDNETILSLRTIFEQTVELTYNLFGEKALYMPENGSQKKNTPTKTIYDPLMQVVAKNLDNSERLIENKNKLKNLLFKNSASLIYKSKNKDIQLFDGKYNGKNNVSARIKYFSDIFYEIL